MNGAGNRFAVFDARGNSGFVLSGEKVKNICKPGSSVMGAKGADQLIIVRDPKSPGADMFMEIRNQQGSEADACGNASRCIAWLYMRDEVADNMVLETNAGLLLCAAAGDNLVSVDMGAPKLEWQQIPLKEVMHTHHIDVKVGPIDAPVLHNPGAVNMGNPHCVFFVEDFETAKPDKVGPMIEFHPLFPEQANIGFARVDRKDKIRLKVWERGVGMTLACGTLLIKWRESDDHVIMTGPVELESEGVI